MTQGSLPDWSVEIRLEEDGPRTVAVARLSTGERHVDARGAARRSPIDPELPRVGEDLAVARALSHLAHALVSEAAEQLESVTHAPAGIRD